MLSCIRVLSMAFSLTLVACGPSAPGDGSGGNGNGPDARPGSGGGNEFTDARPTERCDKMDILVVVDDSGSMSEEQANLGQNFPQFISVLDAYQTESGDFLDYRIGVTSTGRDVDYTVQPPAIPGFPTLPPITQSERGLNGEMVQECGMTRRWLERNDTDVANTFACAANLGTSGPSLEMPLRATELAFNDRMADGTNAGFLRDDALLAIVILTDEDDCSRNDNNFTVENDACDSAQPEIVATSHYISMLDDLTGNRGRWATAVIAGPGPGSCSSSFGDAAEATRLRDFVQATGNNAVFSSICEGDLASALGDALDTFEEACDNFPPVL